MIVIDRRTSMKRKKKKDFKFGYYYVCLKKKKKERKKYISKIDKQIKLENFLLMIKHYPKNMKCANHSKCYIGFI